MSKKKSSKLNYRELTDQIRQLLGAKVTVELAEATGYKDIVDAMTNGEVPPNVCELLARKVVQLAIDLKKPNQWAVELVYDRMEGKVKPTQDSSGEHDYREDELDDLSASHLNYLGASVLREADKEGGIPEPSHASNRSPATVGVSLPSYRSGNTKGQSQKPDVEEGTSQGGST